MTKCETCGLRPKRPGERFCGLCRHRLLKEMKDEGYLTKVPRTRHGGDSEAGLPEDKPVPEPLLVEDIVDAQDRSDS